MYDTMVDELVQALNAFFLPQGKNSCFFIEATYPTAISFLPATFFARYYKCVWEAL
jgi:hypothetical protein